MAEPNFERLQDLFNKARQLSAEERVSFLDQACESDAELRREVEVLLEHDNSELIDDSPLGLTRPIAEMVQGRTMAIKGSNRNESLEHSRIGPYLLLKKIGEGGMGTVWMAEQKEPVRRMVALKLIRAGKSDKRILKRFEAERQALAMMDHANIAKILNAGTTDDGMPYFVMELVKGIPISQYCDQNNLTPRERLELFVPVCNAVQHAHQKGIIHRDLKPSNVLVATQDDKPIVKVIDFGLAKALQPQLKLTPETMHTEFGQIMGTLQYMSPEQAGVGNLDVDTRADIYSLGSILYRLLTGFTPIDDDSLRQKELDEIYRMIREQDPPRPSRRLADTDTKSSPLAGSNPQSWKSSLRNELDWIVMCAINKNREQRYKTVAAMADDIRNYLSGNPIAARPPSPWYQFIKLVGRNKGFAATLVTVAAILLISLGAITWFALQTSQALSQAKTETTRATQAEAEQRKAAELARLREDEKGEIAKELEVKVVELEDQKLRADQRAVEADEERQNAETTTRFLRRMNYNLTLREVAEIARESAGLALSLLEDQERCPPELREVGWKFLYSKLRQHKYIRGRHDRPVWGLDLSPDGRSLVSACKGGVINLWDADNGEHMRSLRVKGPISTANFFPDGSKLFVGHSRKGWIIDSSLLKILDHKEVSTEGKEGNHLFSFGKPMLDGHVLTAGTEAKAYLWNQQLTSEKVFIDDYHWKSIAYYAARNQVVVGRNPAGVTIHDYPSGELIKTLPGFKHWVDEVSVSENGILAAQEFLGRIVIWNLDEETAIDELNCNRQAVHDVAISPDGGIVAASGPGGTIRVWRINEDGKFQSEDATRTQYQVLHGHSGPVYSLCFSQDSKLLFSGGADAKVICWDLQAIRASEEFVKFRSLPVCADFAVNQELVVTGGTDGIVSLWNSGTGESLGTFKAHPHGVRSVELADNGQLVTTGAKSAAIWDLKNRKLKHRWNVTEDNNYVSGGAKLTHDGGKLAFGDGNHLKVIDVRTGETAFRKKPSWNQVYSVAFSPDNRLVAASTRDHDNWIGILDVATGEIKKKLKGHMDTAVALAFSQDGLFLASAGLDRNIRLWNTQTGDCIHVLRGHSGSIKSLAISQDQQTLVSCSREDRKIIFWDLGSGQRRYEFTVEQLGKPHTVKLSNNDKTFFVCGTKGAQSYKLGSGEDRSLGLVRTDHEVNLKTESKNIRGALREVTKSTEIPAGKIEAEAFETPGGYFFRLAKDSKTWVETNRTGKAEFRFLETGRDSRYVYIRDSSRSLDIRLPLAGGESGLSTNEGRTWSAWHKVKSVKKPNLAAGNQSN